MPAARLVFLAVAVVGAGASPPRSRTFEAEQRAIPRVAAAFAAAEPRLRSSFTRSGVSYPPSAIFLRAFKRDRVLELWVNGKDSRYVLVESYAICASSGVLGPKRRQGDGQVPEGFYRVNDFNPASAYHLSLGLDYPNAADRRNAPVRPGGSIYIHGDCVTIGCIPITDDRIEEVYVAAVLARSAGQSAIPVHVFPARLTDEALGALARDYAGSPELVTFWQNLKLGFDLFERDRRPPRVRSDARGRYTFR